MSSYYSQKQVKHLPEGQLPPQSVVAAVMATRTENIYISVRFWVMKINRFTMGIKDNSI